MSRLSRNMLASRHRRPRITRADVGRTRGRRSVRHVHDDDQEPGQLKGKWVLTFAKEAPTRSR